LALQQLLFHGIRSTSIASPFADKKVPLIDDSSEDIIMFYCPSPPAVSNRLLIIFSPFAKKNKKQQVFNNPAVLETKIMVTTIKEAYDLNNHGIYCLEQRRHLELQLGRSLLDDAKDTLRCFQQSISMMKQNLAQLQQQEQQTKTLAASLSRMVDECCCQPNLRLHSLPQQQDDTLMDIDHSSSNCSSSLYVYSNVFEIISQYEQETTLSTTSKLIASSACILFNMAFFYHMKGMNFHEGGDDDDSCYRAMNLYQLILQLLNETSLQHQTSCEFVFTMQFITMNNLGVLQQDHDPNASRTTFQSLWNMLQATSGYFQEDSIVSQQDRNGFHSNCLFVLMMRSNSIGSSSHHPTRRHCAPSA
jgi:hypothetical protein